MACLTRKKNEGNDGMMGGMMGPAMAGWTLLSLALLAAAVAGGIWAARQLARHGPVSQVSQAPPPGLADAQALLRRRYAAGEIGREEYLQGKVDLE
jgi:putative membrane protein